MASSISALRALRLLPSASPRTCLLPVARASTTPYKTADPAIHSDPPQEEGGLANSPEDEEYKNDQERRQIPLGAKQPYDVSTPMPSSRPKLVNNPVSPPEGPTFQQKRRVSFVEVSCVGVDGTPLKGGESQEGGGGERRQQQEAEEEYREYYRDRKASPLSEVEFADTRKPISRAMDGEKMDDVWGGEGRGYLVEDTVDEALARAEAMFQAAREAGDPDSPHGRALRRKLRERYQKGEEVNAAAAWIGRNT